MLSQLVEPDDDATAIAAAVLRQLWRPVPPRHGWRSLESWFAAHDRNRHARAAGSGGFPATLFPARRRLRHDLLASSGPAIVLHGDLHHLNVLRAERADWLAIDPKGLQGDRC